jgi:hypothetical protein
MKTYSDSKISFDFIITRAMHVQCIRQYRECLGCAFSRRWPTQRLYLMIRTPNKKDPGKKEKSAKKIGSALGKPSAHDLKNKSKTKRISRERRILDPIVYGETRTKNIKSVYNCWYESSVKSLRKIASQYSKEYYDCKRRLQPLFIVPHSV